MELLLRGPFVAVDELLLYVAVGCLWARHRLGSFRDRLVRRARQVRRRFIATLVHLGFARPVPPIAWSRAGHNRAPPDIEEVLCRLRVGARGPVAECRLRRLEDGRYEYTPKKGAAFTVTAQALVRRLVALTPPARRHFTSFHGVFAPHAALRPVVTRKPEPAASPPPTAAAPKKKPKLKRRLNWAELHRHTFGTDVLRCPCGGRRRIHAVHTTRRAAEERLAELGISPPTNSPPPATAPPPQ